MVRLARWQLQEQEIPEPEEGEGEAMGWREGSEGVTAGTGRVREEGVGEKGVVWKKGAEA